MYTKFLNIFKTKKGFTLVEIFMCVTVLGILTAVAIPIFNVSLKKKKQEDCNNQKQMISTTVKEAMAGMMDSGKAQSVIPIDEQHPIEASHLYKKVYLRITDCTLGDIRGGYRASGKVDASNTTNTYDDGCKANHYLKKYDMKDTKLYIFFSNQELPRCPFDDDGTKGAEYVIDIYGNCFCTYCDADNITEPSTSEAAAS